MLSKKEREFVEDPFSFSKERAKVLRHRVKMRLKKAKSDLDLLFQNEYLTRIDPTKLLGVARIQDSNACQTNLADQPKHDKGISGFQNNETKRYGSFSEFENW
ncbi:MAG: hypothetical protein QW177_07150 [Candidatus Nitrosotenuis sp.]